MGVGRGSQLDTKPRGHQPATAGGLPLGLPQRNSQPVVTRRRASKGWHGLESEHGIRDQEVAANFSVPV